MTSCPFSKWGGKEINRSRVLEASLLSGENTSSSISGSNINIKKGLNIFDLVSFYGERRRKSLE